MNIAQAKDQIKDAVEAYMQRDDAGMYIIHPSRQRPIFLVGAPGIGKTAIMEQIAQELEIGIVSYSMTHHTRQSALGLPRIVHHEYGDFEYEASEYTMSEIVAAMYDYMECTELKRGILFLDEINCVSETLYPSMLQFLQFKTFGRHRIPEDWIVVCAGNPPEYNRSVHEFDVVTLDRLREIEVDPDVTVWRKYALERGIHPAVTTFLESKPDCFYKVESKPGGGKSFVTARGWEDLAEAISLYEMLEKKVSRDFIGQYLRDEEIADKFAVYYSLFEKYRSDYQVGRILEGDAGAEIVARAKAAEFDERIALLGLLLDSLSNSCNAALEQESICLELRDELRVVKQKVLVEGKTASSSLDAPLKEREKRLQRKITANTAKPAFVRRERLVIKLLKDFIMQLRIDGSNEGDAAFNTINRVYKLEVGKISPLASKANSEMNSAFDFVEQCFKGGREMLVFVAEITTRAATTQFVSHFGNEKYFEHSDDLKVDEARANLYKRVQEISDITTAGPDYDTLEKPGAVSLRSGGDGSKSYEAQMAEYYQGKQFEFGFASMSKMTLPFEKLRGATVLDVGCRRGKGAYKLSANVGRDGHVIGVDWSPSYVAEAQAGSARAAADNGLPQNNMEFIAAFPEDLASAGIGNASVDVVYINNVSTLLFDPAKALREFSRVLKPGGLLIYETVLSDKKRDETIVEMARSIGNSIQAARTREEIESLMVQAGFAAPEVADEYEVFAEQGFIASKEVQVVESDEDIVYKATALNAIKR